MRNAKVIDTCKALQEYNLNLTVYDPRANPMIAEREYGVQVINQQSQITNQKYDAIMLAVAHNQFKELDVLALSKESVVVYDVKGILNRPLIDGRL